MRILLTISIIFINTVSCSSPTHFEDKNKPSRGPASITVNQSIANESPISKGCSKLLNEVLYLSEQRKYKEKRK